MKSQLSNCIACKLAEYGAIAKEDCDTYAYGINLLLSALLHIATTVFIGFVFQMLPECIFFYGSFAVLRRFVGGYHAGSPVRCYILSCLVIIAVLLAVKYINPEWMIPVETLILFLCGIVILWLAPVEDANKPLDDEEIQHYKRTGRIIWLIETAAAVTLMAVGLKNLALSMCLSQAVLAGMLASGKLKNMHRLAKAE